MTTIIKALMLVLSFISIVYLDGGRDSVFLSLQTYLAPKMNSSQEKRDKTIAELLEAKRIIIVDMAELIRHNLWGRLRNLLNSSVSVDDRSTYLREVIGGLTWEKVNEMPDDLRKLVGLTFNPGDEEEQKFREHLRGMFESSRQAWNAILKMRDFLNSHDWASLQAELDEIKHREHIYETNASSTDFLRRLKAYHLRLAIRDETWNKILQMPQDLRELAGLNVSDVGLAQLPRQVDGEDDIDSINVEEEFGRFSPAGMEVRANIYHVSISFGGIKDLSGERQAEAVLIQIRLFLDAYRGTIFRPEIYLDIRKEARQCVVLLKSIIKDQKDAEKLAQAEAYIRGSKENVTLMTRFFDNVKRSNSFDKGLITDEELNMLAGLTRLPGPEESFGRFGPAAVELIQRPVSSAL